MKFAIDLKPFQIKTYEKALLGKLGREKHLTAMIKHGYYALG